MFPGTPPVFWARGERIVVGTTEPHLQVDFSVPANISGSQKIVFHHAYPCQRPRFAKTYVCSKMLGLVWFGLWGFWAPLWRQLQVLKSITIQVARGSLQSSAVCLRPVLRNQAGPSYLSGKFVAFQGPPVSCKS